MSGNAWNTALFRRWHFKCCPDFHHSESWQLEPNHRRNEKCSSYALLNLSWKSIESRDAYAFFEDDIVATLQEVLGMSEQAASNWFNGTETVETSIAQLVPEIKEYVDSQPKDLRLLFMIDEVGQYVGGDMQT